ncbi:MAG TPA: hypothetical protein VGP70_24670 [Actinomadura sp.]|jgi:hypothetical protein|nr:hypothetical protein [Actinomadura sp.]
MGRDETGRFDDRWAGIEAGFPVDPLDALRRADDLVGDLMNAITRSLGDRRGDLAAGWRDENNQETDDADAQGRAIHAYRRYVIGILT